ncbi:amidohydrolase family protein [Leptolinea tardivitalis]|uniref:5-methylthioadenosine/S-adenosylhomocysteine deaminase n=1 Tax=Leptolinea tardivitalis TaxID=229920 RepID=A0A0P6WVL7_9CHLR|nr:amidohydrolase family protein [Leptolinea tardivitalis]KPL74294.1 amidohydrolase [Leptolinea tardivitalis]GAP20519.1 cytosine deaminase [Leptolinea tardivitalis]
MKTVDLILTNAVVLTMDEEFHTFEPGAVAVSGNSIAAVGMEADILKDYSASKKIDCNHKVLMPGLVNAHTHVPMTLLRGLADDLRLDVWLMGYMMPVEREFVSPDFVQLGTKLACAEMIRSGVTTFADMYYFEDDIARATQSAGMRAVCGQSVMKFPTPDAKSFEDSLALARDFIIRWKDNDLIVPAVAPHAPYTCTPEILNASASLAVEFDVPLHTHLAETAGEVENMRNEHGIPVIPYMKKQNLFEAKVIAAHCVHIDEGEMRTLLHTNAGVAHNPSSNMKLASGIAPVKRLIELGVKVGIGTDGPASNNDLDMFEEMRLASFLAKVSSGDPTALPARTTLLMATRLGAEALHIGNITGSLEPGKRADMILVDVSPTHNSPRFKRDPHNVYAQIIYAAKANDVTDVIINGQWVMQNRVLTTLNEADLLTAGNEYARKIDSFLIQREQSVLSKLIAIGGATEEESFEVQAKIAIPSVDPILTAIKTNPEIKVVRTRHYHQFDTYMKFDDPSQGYVRYREDHSITDTGEITGVRSRLTLVGQTREHPFREDVLLSRSRFLAPATQSLRFYKEYFKPQKTVEIEKNRMRYLVNFKDTEFFINVDNFTEPNLGSFLEVKSRTWSKQDAEKKAHLAEDLIKALGASPSDVIASDYIEMASKS